MIKNIYKWTGVLYDIANMPWMHHHKIKSRDKSLLFILSVRVKVSNLRRSRLNKEKQPQNVVFIYSGEGCL